MKKFIHTLATKMLEFICKHWIEIVVSVLAITATILCWSKNILCWYFWIASGVGWWMYFAKNKSWFFFGFEFVWQAINIIGIIRWMND